MNEDLHAAVLNKITDVVESEDFLAQVADAAVQAVLEAGYFKAAGVEYVVRQGDRVVETGFNTEGQARAWARERLGDVPYDVQFRRIGVLEPTEPPNPNVP